MISLSTSRNFCLLSKNRKLKNKIYEVQNRFFPLRIKNLKGTQTFFFQKLPDARIWKPKMKEKNRSRDRFFFFIFGFWI